MMGSGGSRTEMPLTLGGLNPRQSHSPLGGRRGEGDPAKCLAEQRSLGRSDGKPVIVLHF